MLSEAQMKADSQEAARQQQAFDTCRAMIEEIPIMSPERFALVKKMAAHNSRFAAEKGDEYIARQWRRLFSEMTEHQIKGV